MAGNLTPAEAWSLAVFAMRVAVVAVLYLFLLTGFTTLRRELRASGAIAIAGRAAVGGAEQPRAPAWLEVLAGEGDADERPRHVPLAAVTTIGRDPDCGVHLDDPRVSTRHARVRWRDGTWWIEDLGSTNGTRVEGRPVHAAVPLTAGALIDVGPVGLRLVERVAPTPRAEDTAGGSLSIPAVERDA